MSGVWGLSYILRHYYQTCDVIRAGLPTNQRAIFTRLPIRVLHLARNLQTQLELSDAAWWEEGGWTDYRGRGVGGVNGMCKKGKGVVGLS
jgi:hypothetical protein